MEFFNQYLDWVLAIVGLFGQYITFVKKSWWAVWFGLGSQVGWVYYAIIRNDLGLVPLCIGSTTILIIAIINDRKIAMRAMRPENAEKNHAVLHVLHLDKVLKGDEHGSSG